MVQKSFVWFPSRSPGTRSAPSCTGSACLYALSAAGKNSYILCEAADRALTRSRSSHGSLADLPFPRRKPAGSRVGRARPPGRGDPGGPGRDSLRNAVPPSSDLHHGQQPDGRSRLRGKLPRCELGRQRWRVLRRERRFPRRILRRQRIRKRRHRAGGRRPDADQRSGRERRVRWRIGRKRYPTGDPRSYSVGSRISSASRRPPPSPRALQHQVGPCPADISS